MKFIVSLRMYCVIVGVVRNSLPHRVVHIRRYVVYKLRMTMVDINLYCLGIVSTF